MSTPEPADVAADALAALAEIEAEIEAEMGGRLAAERRVARRMWLVLEWGGAVLVTILAYTLTGGWRGEDVVGRWMWLVASLAALYCWGALTLLLVADIVHGRLDEWGESGLRSGCAAYLVLPFLAWAYCGLGAGLVLRAYDAAAALGWW